MLFRSILSVGPNWWTSRNVRYSGRKWNAAQMNYTTHNQEYQAVVDGVAKNDLKLRGRKFYVLVDNKQVAQMLTSKHLNRRQHRLLDYLSEFDFEVLYIKGEENVGPDALSRQWEDGNEATSPDPTDAYLLDLDSEFRDFGSMSIERQNDSSDSSEDALPHRESAKYFEDEDDSLSKESSSSEESTSSERQEAHRREMDELVSIGRQLSSASSLAHARSSDPPPPLKDVPVSDIEDQRSSIERLIGRHAPLLEPVEPHHPATNSLPEDNDDDLNGMPGLEPMHDSDSEAPVASRMVTRSCNPKRLTGQRDAPSASGSSAIDSGFEGLTSLHKRFADEVMEAALAEGPEVTLAQLQDRARYHCNFGLDFIYGKKDSTTGQRTGGATHEHLFDRFLDHECSIARCVFQVSEVLAAGIPERNMHLLSSKVAKQRIGLNELFPDRRATIENPRPPARGPPKTATGAPLAEPNLSPQAGVPPANLPRRGPGRPRKTPLDPANAVDAPVQPGKNQRRLDQVVLDREAEAWDLPEDSAIDLDEFYDAEFKQAITSSYGRDTTFKKVIADLPAFPQYRLADGLLWQDDDHWGARLCVPKAVIRGRSVHEVILEHTHQLAGHGGAAKTLASLSHLWWWPSITRDTVAYCATCPPCQATKVETQAPRGKLHSMPIPSKPYEEIAIDFQGPFPMSEFRDQPVNFLFNFLDCLSGEVIMVPCLEEGLTSQKCAEIFLHEVYPHWGTPSVIRSDRDIRFTSAFWKSVTQALGTTLAMSSSFHPATNGKIERMHRTANQVFRLLVSEEQTDWPKHTPHVQLAINTTVSKSSGFAPFELTRVQIPISIPEWAKAPGRSAAGKFIEAAKARQAAARDALLRSQVDQTSSANKHRRPDYAPTSTSAEGEPNAPTLFWLSTKNLSSVLFRSRKWTPRFVGPFECLHYNPRTSSYTLKLTRRYTRRNINNVFHSSLCKPYAPSDPTLFPNRITSLTPVFPLDSLEIGVSRILNTRWLPKDPARPDDLLGSTRLQLDVQCDDGTRTTLVLPNADVSKTWPPMVEYLAAHNERQAIDHPNWAPIQNWRGLPGKVRSATESSTPPKLTVRFASATAPSKTKTASPSSARTSRKASPRTLPSPMSKQPSPPKESATSTRSRPLPRSSRPLEPTTRRSQPHSPASARDTRAATPPLRPTPSRVLRSHLRTAPPAPAQTVTARRTGTTPAVAPLSSSSRLPLPLASAPRSRHGPPLPRPSDGFAPERRSTSVEFAMSSTTGASRSRTTDPAAWTSTRTPPLPAPSLQRASAVSRPLNSASVPVLAPQSASLRPSGTRARSATTVAMLAPPQLTGALLDRFFAHMQAVDPSFSFSETPPSMLLAESAMRASPRPWTTNATSALAATAPSPAATTPLRRAPSRPRSTAVCAPSTSRVPVRPMPLAAPRTPPTVCPSTAPRAPLVAPRRRSPRTTRSPDTSKISTMLSATSRTPRARMAPSPPSNDCTIN